MSSHLERGRLLYDQRRFALAAAEFQSELGAEPESAEAHAYLALALMEMKRLDEALKSAEVAVGLAPDGAFQHNVRAIVFSRQGRHKDAHAAAAEALRLAPLAPHYHWLHAATLFDLRRQREALQACEEGLRLAPEQIDLRSLRARVLQTIGRHAEAAEDLEVALARSPESARLHANQGWLSLRTARADDALKHFGEALRIDPANAWAREGFVTALKARYRVYRIVLGCVFLLQRLPRPARIAVTMTLYPTLRLLIAVGDEIPSVRWIAGPLILCCVFALLCWLGGPLFDALVLFHPLGRHALSPTRLRRTVFWCDIVLILTGAVSLGFVDAPVLVVLAWFGIASLAVPIGLAILGFTRRSRRILLGLAAGLFTVLVGIVVAAERMADPLDTMNIALCGVAVSLAGAVCSMALAKRLTDREENARASVGRG